MIANSNVFCRYVFLMLLLCYATNAQELSQIRLTGKAERLTGELIDHSKKDANGQVCAGLVVESDLDGLTFDSNNGVLDVVRKPGRDFLFLSPDERVVTVFKTGYRPIRIILSDLGIKLASGEVWQLKVTGDRKADQIPISVVTDPPDARIFIDSVNKGTAGSQQTSPGRHEIRVEREGYRTRTQTVEVSPSNILFHFKLDVIEPIAVSITSKPTGAKIILNGVDRGETDKGLFLYPGIYTLRLQKSGCVDVEKQITISEGGQNTFTVALTKNIGTFELSVLPADAKVLLNREDYSNRTTVELAPGRYKIEVSSPGYADTSEVLDVVQGGTIRRSYTLRARTGSLRVAVQPLQARIALKRGGKIVETWQGMKQLTNLLVGEYECDCTLDGYRRVREPARVEENKTVVLDIQMKQGSVSSMREEMVLVEGGPFEMGSSNGGGDERPVHQVYVKSFYIGKYEVTQRQWKEVMNTNPSYIKDCEECPVEDVTWDDALEYIEKLNAETGRHYRLPTEAEWEFAARGRDSIEGFPYSGSDTLDNVAWYAGNSDSRTHPVGTKKPNKLGLFDMNGNVWEWCSDWYDENYYSNSPERDPAGPKSGTYRVLRGGSWYTNAYLCRVSLRFRYSPVLRVRSSGYGFRLAED